MKHNEMKKWLRLQEQEANAKRKDSNTFIGDDGNEYDILMSQEIGDEWYFGFANSDLEDKIPKFDMDSAIYAIAMDCLVRLMFVFDDEDLIRNLVEESISIGKNIKNKK